MCKESVCTHKQARRKDLIEIGSQMAGFCKMCYFVHDWCTVKHLHG